MSAAKGTPVAESHLEAGSGKRYVRVTSGGPEPTGQVVQYTDGAVVCLRSACLAEQRGTRCGHYAAARAYLDALDAQPVEPQAEAA